MNVVARRLELCAALNAIAKEGIFAAGYFARRAPLWAELSRLSSYDRPPDPAIKPEEK